MISAFIIFTCLFARIDKLCASSHDLYKEIHVNYRKSITKSPAGEQNFYWYDRPGARNIVMRNSELPDWLKEAAVSMIDDGYAVIKDSLPHQMCDDAVKSFKEYVAENPAEAKASVDSYGHYNRLYNLHTAKDAALHIMTRNYKTLMLMDFLFGAKTSIGNTIFFSRGSQQNMHVDIPFFWTVPGCRYFGVWAALEDVDANNGPLMVLKGGHRCNILEKRSEIPELLAARGSVKDIKANDGIAFNIYGSATINNCAKQNITEIIQVHVNKGDTIIWHPLLPHGGSQIIDMTRSRFSLISHQVPEMTPLYHTDIFFNPEKKASAQPHWDYRVEKAEEDIQDFRLVGIGPQFKTMFHSGY